MDPVSNTIQRPIISQEAWERGMARIKKVIAENRARLSPEEQRELAERDERLKATEGFQQVGESGE